MVGALPALHPFSPLLLMLEGVEHTLPAHHELEISLLPATSPPCLNGYLQLRFVSVDSSFDSLPAVM